MLAAFLSATGEEGSDQQVLDENHVVVPQENGDALYEDDSPRTNTSGDFSTMSDPRLEGNLLVRKGRATGHGSVRWKKRYVNLDFANGGSISVYEETPEAIRHQLNQARLQSEGANRHTSLYSKFHRRVSAVMHDPFAIEENPSLLLHIPSDLPWMAKDVENAASTFAIEIPTSEGENGENGDMHIGEAIAIDAPGGDPSASGGDASTETHSQIDDLESTTEDQLYDEIAVAKQKGKPFRIYFKCRKGSSEKALWLEAFLRIDRLSIATRHTHGLLSAISNGVRLRPNHRARKRANSHEQFASDARKLGTEFGDDFSMNSDASGTTARMNQMFFGKPSKKNEDKEYKVLPGYAYPHRWMTIRELYKEMMLPSAHFHDLRDVNNQQQSKEIGDLRVEVLQCIGLPRLDRASDTDAVIYMVCGPCAFVTDVIPDHTNPVWLSKTRRACIFPIFHGYARLYVGVFDDDGGWVKDDFAGRVVIDIARLRHSSTYDVTLPLRMSTHAYSRRRRGAVRLRFTLHWKNEKDVLLSYIPKKFKFVPPQHAKPNLSTTIPCADPKAFRNVAITVHGIHMSGRFTFPKVKAVIREINFTRKYVIGGIRQEIKDTRTWVNPTMSGFVFCAWMHCIYEDKFSLVPGYVVLYIILQLIRTYAIYAVEATVSEGFVPPTWEEMFDALVKPRSATSIEPLHLQRKGGIATSFHGDEPETMHVSTHQPKGRWLFKALGFIPWNEELSSQRNLHMEFPFADGDTYEKFKIKDCLADTQADETEGDLSGGNMEDEDLKEVDSFETESTLSLATNTDKKPTKSVMKVLSPMRRASPPNSSKSSERGSEPSDDSDDGRDVEEEDQSASGDEEEPLHEDSAMMTTLENCAEAVRAIDPLHLRKDQDMDWKSEGGEKLTDSLERIKYKMHSITWHNFNDYVYDIKDPDSVYFFEAKNIEKRRHRKKQNTTAKKLDKLLGVKQYSHNNPLISRLGLYVEPMIDAIYGYICIFRAGFNVVSWQDPYLTFLLSVVLANLAIILFIIPWRPVLFAVGMLFVGPQNWVIRKLRERGTLPPVKPKERKEEEPQENPGQVFHCHKRLDGILAPKPPPSVDPLEVQHIVVPYGPLMYQRFYDWPPEQQYANVVPERTEMSRDVSGLSVGTATSSNNRQRNQKPGTRYARLHKLRRRVQRGKKQEMTLLLEDSAEALSDEEDNDPGPVSSANKAE